MKIKRRWAWLMALSQAGLATLLTKLIANEWGRMTGFDLVVSWLGLVCAVVVGVAFLTCSVAKKTDA